MIDDRVKPVLMDVSNDAYHYFKYSESPLDEASLDEIAEISATFGDGIEIELISTLESSGKYKVKIVPKSSVPQQKYDGLIHLPIKNIALLLYVKAKNKIRGVCINENDMHIIYEQDYDVVSISKKPWITNGNTKIPLWTNLIEIKNSEAFTSIFGGSSK